MRKKRRQRPVNQAWAPDPLDDPKRIANWLAFQREQRLASKQKAAAKKRKKFSKMRKELGLPGFSRPSSGSAKRVTGIVSGGVFSEISIRHWIRVVIHNHILLGY